jgi:hypothetical protein
LDILATSPLSKCIFKQWVSLAHRELCVKDSGKWFQSSSFHVKLWPRVMHPTTHSSNCLPTTNHNTANCNQGDLIYRAQVTVATLAFYSDPSETLYSGFEKVVMSEGTTTTQRLEDMCSYLYSHLREELPRNPRQTAYKAACRPCR